MINQEGKIGLALLTDEGISIREKLSGGMILSIIANLIISKGNSITEGTQWTLNIVIIFAMGIMIMIFLLRVVLQKVKIRGNVKNYNKLVIEGTVLGLLGFVFIIAVVKIIERFTGLTIPFEIIIK